MMYKDHKPQLTNQPVNKSIYLSIYLNLLLCLYCYCIC